jgi:hypothetical protein
MGGGVVAVRSDQANGSLSDAESRAAATVCFVAVWWCVLKALTGNSSKVIKRCRGVG